MKFIQLGNSPLQVSSFCLGTMTFGQQNSEAEAHAQLDYAVQRGINFIDTAEMYPVPPRADTVTRTETIIGNWLQSQPRDKIILATSTDVRVYFVSEGAGYHNSMGVASQMPGDPTPYNSWDQAVASSSRLLFPDASSTEGSVTDGTGTYGTRTQSEPLLPGDFVNAGTYAAGTKLDFFLLSGGANNYWANSFSTAGSLNPDGFSQHVAAFTTHLFATPQLNSPFIFLSFEDSWGGGDQDINDVVIAVDVGAATVKSLLATPEPAMPLTFTACLGLALFAVRKNRKAAATV